MERAPQEIRTFFITAVAANRRRLFQTDANSKLLLNLFNEDRTKGRYQLHAFVLMPDHLHLLLTPAPDVSIEKAMQYIKGGFSFRLKSKLPVWEQSYTLRRVEDPCDYETHRDYIHANPVQAHLCERAEDFPWSSASLTVTVDPSPEHLGPKGRRRRDALFAGLKPGASTAASLREAPGAFFASVRGPFAFSFRESPKKPQQTPAPQLQSMC